MNDCKLFQGKKCVTCGQFFALDPRIGNRQKCCRAVNCRNKRKRMQEKAWKSRNPGYFDDSYVQYVKPWRQEHPGYQKAWRAKKQPRCKSGREIKTPSPPAPLIKSMRIHLWCKWHLDEIKTQTLRVTYAGQAFWVYGVRTQGP